MLTQEQILQRGIRAAEILGHEQMMEFIEGEKGLLLDSIANTQTHETRTRESLYNQHHAITSFFQGLQQYVDAAQAIVKLADDEQQNEQDQTD